MEIDIFALLGVIGFTSLALCIDLKCRRIPNWLTVSSAVIGLAYHSVTNGVPGLLTSLGGFGTGFGMLLILWLIGSGGGGDVKMMGAVGSWLGAPATLLVFIGSAVFAVACTIALVIWQRFNKRALATAGPADAVKVPAFKQTIPYALPVAMTIWAMFLFRVTQR